MTDEKRLLDSELDQLTKKIAQRRLNKLSESNHFCIGYFKNEIANILISTKKIDFHKSLYDNGFDIGFIYLGTILHRHGIYRFKHKNSLHQQQNNTNTPAPQKADLILSTNNQNEENRKKPENRITAKQLRLEAEAEIKEMNKNAKPIHSKAVQKIIDKQKEKERLKNEQENSGS